MSSCRSAPKRKTTRHPSHQNFPWFTLRGPLAHRRKGVARSPTGERARTLALAVLLWQAGRLARLAKPVANNGINNLPSFTASAPDRIVTDVRLASCRQVRVHLRGD